MERKKKIDAETLLAELVDLAKKDPSFLVNREVGRLLIKPSGEVVEYLLGITKKKDGATLMELLVAKKISDLFGFK